MPSSSSSAQQALAVLGDRLREIRIEAGFTGRHLALLAGWHRTKVSKIEHGRTTPTPTDIEVWCQCCRATDQTADLIASLRAVEGMFVEWRRLERSGLKVVQESVVPLWEQTRRFRIYSSWLIPGPLQTSAYIRAVLSALGNRREVPDDVDAAVQVRVNKQHILYERGHTFAVILEESVLRYRIGDVPIMVEQLTHLFSVASLPSLSLGVIPLDADRSTLWPVEMFFIFDNGRVNVELVSGHLVVTQPREIVMYAKVFSQLSNLAVYGAEAKARIAAAIEALDTRTSKPSTLKHTH
jgi:transcriptional regulator with XRE-family HTH domain